MTRTMIIIKSGIRLLIISLILPYFCLYSKGPLNCLFEITRRVHLLGQTEIYYLADMPEGVIRIVHQCASLNELEKWLNETISKARMRGQFNHEEVSQEELSYVEIIALLFGFESNPDKSIVHIASIAKDMQLTEEDKERIWDAFYNSEK